MLHAARSSPGTTPKRRNSGLISYSCANRIAFTLASGFVKVLPIKPIKLQAFCENPIRTIVMIALTGAYVNHFVRAYQYGRSLNNNYSHLQTPVETEASYCNELPKSTTITTRIERSQKHRFSTKK
jgi:hypothetical protein